MKEQYPVFFGYFISSVIKKERKEGSKIHIVVRKSAEHHTYVAVNLLKWVKENSLEGENRARNP